MIEIVELHRVKHTGPCWAEVEKGDGLVWSSGAIYIVDSIGVDDGKHVTYVLKCIVPRLNDSRDQEFGSLAHLHAKKSDPLPNHITLVKPT